LSPGKIFHGHYEVVRCISTGAMGAVYEVVDQKTHRRRALKVMLPSLVSNAEMRQRFKLEATVTADILSEHIVETFDADVDAETGAPFLVMELLRGEDLANVLAARGKLQASEVVLVLSQAARALDKTHAAGVVHRDLKPENLFITQRDDGSPRIKILDFGIAKVAAAGNAQNAKQTINLGTPPYMSPEQIMGEGTIDHRADIYALAHIAYALLVGEPYWLEDSRSCESLYNLLLRIVEGAKEPPTQRARRYGVTLPPAFDPWFARATSVLPAMRFDRASDLVLELAAVLGVPLETRPAARTSSPDWELDSVQLSRTSLIRLAGGQLRAPNDARSTPGATPLPGTTGPARAAKSPPPAPHPAAAEKGRRRRALWIGAAAIAFLIGFGLSVVLIFVVRARGQQAAATATPAGAEAPPQPTAQPTVVSAVTPASASSGTPVAGVDETAAATSPAPSVLPSAAPTGKTGGSAKPHATGTATGRTGKTSPHYDPLREL
jgi:serine/threonine-protein kinase